jgi:hypothetical protein
VRQYGRRERWGRLVKRLAAARDLATGRAAPVAGAGAEGFTRRVTGRKPPEDVAVRMDPDKLGG